MKNNFVVRLVKVWFIALMVLGANVALADVVTIQNSNGKYLAVGVPAYDSEMPRDTVIQSDKPFYWGREIGVGNPAPYRLFCLINGEKRYLSVQGDDSRAILKENGDQEWWSTGATFGKKLVLYTYLDLYFTDDGKVFVKSSSTANNNWTVTSVQDPVSAMSFSYTIKCDEIDDDDDVQDLYLGVDGKLNVIVSPSPFYWNLTVSPSRAKDKGNKNFFCMANGKKMYLSSKPQDLRLTSDINESWFATAFDPHPLGTSKLEACDVNGQKRGTLKSNMLFIFRGTHYDVKNEPTWGGGDTMDTWFIKTTTTPASTIKYAPYQVLGINAAGNLFKKNGVTETDFGGVGDWAQITNVPGGATNAKHVTVGDDASVWLLTKDSKLYRQNRDGSWQQKTDLPANVVQVDAGKYQLIAVTSDNKSYFLKDLSQTNMLGTTWEAITGDEKVAQLSISSTGKLWGVNTAGNTLYRDGVDAKNAWQKKPGTLKQICVGTDDYPWAVNAGTRLYDWRDGKWNDVSGIKYNNVNLFATYVAKGTGNQIYALHNVKGATGYRIFFFKQGTGWQEVGGGLVQIDVGAAVSP